jgi:hypothetical protein
MMASLYKLAQQVVWSSANGSWRVGDYKQNIQRITGSNGCLSTKRVGGLVPGKWLFTELTSIHFQELVLEWGLPRRFQPSFQVHNCLARYVTASPAKTIMSASEGKR